MLMREISSLFDNKEFKNKKDNENIFSNYYNIFKNNNSINDSNLSDKVVKNRKLASKLGWSKYHDEINEILLPYSGSVKRSLSDETFVKTLSNWQYSKGLIADGELGEGTWYRLKQLMRNKALWREMLIRNDKWIRQADEIIIEKIVPNSFRYNFIAEEIQKKTKDAALMPWWFIACIHSAERDCNFNTHLHNGDSLKHFTKKVPKGRPQVGHEPPFTFEESAIDALMLQGFHKILIWDFFYMFYLFEQYNGMANQKYNINTPYLWSGTFHYEKGKYKSDHNFDPDYVSAQVGIAVLIRRLMDLEIIQEVS